MNEYNKIQTVLKRDPATKFKTLLPEFSTAAFDYLRNNTWWFTEKVDGMNWRIKFDGYNITYAGKTDKANLPGDLVAYLTAKLTHKLDLFKELFGPTPVCFYGEGYGAGIQKGGIYRKDKDFILFDIKINNLWLEINNVKDIAAKLKFDVVPFLGYGSLQNMIDMAKVGFKSKWGHFDAEGIVARPTVELIDRYGYRIITKIKHKDFK